MVEYVNALYTDNLQDLRSVNNGIKSIHYHSCSTAEPNPLSRHHRYLLKREFEISRHHVHPNKIPINLALPVRIRHISEHIENLCNIRPAEKIIRDMKGKHDGAILLAKLLNGSEMAANARYRADGADAFEDGHFGRGVRGGGRGAAEDFNINIPDEMSAKESMESDVQMNNRCVNQEYRYRLVS